MRYYDTGYSSPPVVIYQSQPAPPVTIYESPQPARPETREYPDPAPPQQYQKPIYLIAFRSQDNIRAAEAYWVDDGTLHYVTLQHEHKQVPLGSVDRAFSYRLTGSGTSTSACLRSSEHHVPESGQGRMSARPVCCFDYAARLRLRFRIRACLL